jgi:3-oxoacyl-[acyl-carrier-protein] synthase-1
MTSEPLAIISSGMITCNGLSAPSTCAAIRARIANFSKTIFMDRSGEWIVGGQVPLEVRLRGRARLIAFFASAIRECLSRVAPEEWKRLPVVLCLAEPDRPGRLHGIECDFLAELCAELKAEFHADSTTVAEGRVSVAVALLHARRLLYERKHACVLIAGADSYFIMTTMKVYEEKSRLFTRANSNGFVAGEGGAAVLVSRPVAEKSPQFRILGVGFGQEKATIESDEPLRADGLSLAITAALRDAAIELASLDYRIADLAGEQYYFKEAALAITRLLRVHKEEFDIWHPADCVGDTGAAAGIVGLCVSLAASRKGYAPGPGVLLHCAADGGKRASIVARYG